MYKIYAIISAVVIVAVASILVISLGYLNGYSNQAQAQGPQFQINNPKVQGLFDELYKKYPNISQADVNETHRQLTIECISWSEEDRENSNLIAEAMTGAICGGFMHGMMTTWLDGVGISYYDSEDKQYAPTIIQ